MSLLGQGGVIFARIFNLLNRSQKSKADHEETVKAYAKKEWKFILPEDKSEEAPGSWPDFMTACCTGDVSKVTSLLQGDGMIDVNQQDDKGRTALILASKGGHTEIVKQLLKKGADIDIMTNKGKTALMKSCKYGHVSVAKILLDSNCGVNIADHHGYSALILASIHGHSEIAEQLLIHGAEVSMLDKKGVSSLIHACLGECRKVVEILLDHDANVNTIANVAAAIVDDGEYPLSSLMIASLKGNIEIIKLLLANGASVTQANNGELTALQFASFGGSTKVFQMLINHGALQSYKEGCLNLQTASFFGHTEIAEILLNIGVNVDCTTDTTHYTPITLGSMSMQPQIVNLLLKRGADPNTTYDGVPLIAMVCAVNSNVHDNKFPTNHIKIEKKEEVIKLLISSDKVSLRDRLYAFKYCAQDKKLIKVLLHHDSENLLMEAIKNGGPEEIIALTSHGAKVDAKDSNGHTPLALATELGLQKIVDILLACGAEVNQRDSEERSALIHAILNGHADLAIHLIEQGADLDLQDVHGCSALMYAVRDKKFEMVQILVAYCASINLKDINGHTIFDIWPDHHEVLIHQELLKSFLNLSSGYFDIDLNYPGIIFNEPLFAQKLDSSPATIGSIEDEGFLLHVFANSLTSDTEFAIRPCFSGPFELPDEYESASPAYLIHHDKMDLQKDVTIRMHHYASLQSEEDCEDMKFLSASSTPEYRGSRPMYTFKEIQGAKGVFRRGDQVGEISLRHFSIVKVGKRKREEREEETEGELTEKRSRENEYLYSARLYRNIQHKGDVTAIFCACLFSPLYIKHCDEVIMNEYTGMSNKGEGRSQVFARILGDEVTLELIEQPGFTVKFDKNPIEILKSDIHVPEMMKVAVSELVDYPPRLLIYVRQHDTSNQFLPEVQVNGLDRQCRFILQAMSNVQSESNAVVVTPTSIPVPVQPKTLSTAHSDVCLDAESSYLELDDLGEVLDTVEPLSSEWKLLATKLRIKPSSLDIIQHNHPGNAKMCLYEAIEEWLKLNYNHQRHGRPSWRRLVEAVRTLDGALSEKIAEIYIS